MFGDLETKFSHKRLQNIAIDRPIFLSGLARSGTTILLEELSKIPQVATHRYRDFPFVMTPLAWNWFQDRFRKNQTSVERPHKDRIQITSESPEAFEEPIWQFFFSHVHASDRLHRMTGEHANPDFEKFFRDHLRKILLIRQGNRYLSKGNYNVVRFEYLSRVFDDARFIIPVRHPLSHVHSLVKQHQLFCDYSTQDSRVPKYLARAGHYEFGPQRSPIRVTDTGSARQVEAWQAGDDYTGYAIQWSEVYRFVSELRQNGQLGPRILVVRYEDFCDAPLATVQQVLAHTDLPSDSVTASSLSHIVRGEDSSQQLPAAIRECVWRETREIAALFGYNC